MLTAQCCKKLIVLVLTLWGFPVPFAHVGASSRFSAERRVPPHAL